MKVIGTADMDDERFKPTHLLKSAKPPYRYVHVMLYRERNPFNHEIFAKNNKGLYKHLLVPSFRLIPLHKLETNKRAKMLLKED